MYRKTNSENDYKACLLRVYSVDIFKHKMSFLLISLLFVSPIQFTFIPDNKAVTKARCS